MRIITLHAPSFLPRGADWDDEFIIGRVLSVDPTPSAPNGALHFWAREGKTKSRGYLPGGFRCIRFEDIVEVLGAPQAPRQTMQELRAEVRTAKRQARLQARRKRARK